MNRRLYGLDILRAIAVLCVVHAHGVYFLDGKQAKTVYSWFIRDGVTLFFVLSGFLVGGILVRMLDEAGLSGGQLYRFWVRRWFRTLPCYYLTLAAALAIHRASTGTWLPEAWRYALFLQNLAVANLPLFPESWSLAVEEWFYLGFPLCLAIAIGWIRLSPRAAILVVAATVIAGATGLRLWLGANTAFNDYASWNARVHLAVLPRLDAIMYGVLGAYLHRYHGAWFARFATPAFVAGLAILVIDRPWLAPPWLQWQYAIYCKFTLQAVATLLLLPKLTTLEGGAGWARTFFTQVSLLSYSIYLVNYSLVQGALMPWLAGFGLGGAHWPFAARMALFVALTASIAWCMYRFFEVPTTRIRDRFAPAAPPTAA